MKISQAWFKISDASLVLNPAPLRPILLKIIGAPSFCYVSNNFLLRSIPKRNDSTTLHTHTQILAPPRPRS